MSTGRLLDEGADGIVSVHLSRELSGTWESARLAAQEVGVDRVRVVDSRTTVHGPGFRGAAGGRRARPAVRPAPSSRTRRSTRPGADHDVLRGRDARVPAARRPDRVGGGVPGDGARGEAGAACRGRPDRAAGEGAHDAPRGRSGSWTSPSRPPPRPVPTAVELAVHHLGAHERAAELATTAGRADLVRVGLCRVRAGRGDRRAHRSWRARRGGVPGRAVNRPASHVTPTIPRH